MVSVSPINQQYIKSQPAQKQTHVAQEQKETVISKEPKSPFKKINKKLVCSLGAALGIAALAGIIIHKVKSGKAGDIVSEAQKAQEVINPAQKAQEIINEALSASETANSIEIVQETQNSAQKAIENIKQFFDMNDKLTNSVTLQNGRAMYSNAIGFSGTMKIINKKGDDIAIQYRDGYITTSSINKNLFKRYEKTGDLPRSLGVSITRYDNYVEQSSTEIKNYENGKLKRLLIEEKPLSSENNHSYITLKEYSPIGKLSRNSGYEVRTRVNLLYHQIYDEKGNLKRELYKKELIMPDSQDDYVELIYGENGKPKIIKFAKGYTEPRNKVYRPYSITFYDSEGNIEKQLETTSFNDRQNITFKNNKNGDYLNFCERYYQNSPQDSVYSVFVNNCSLGGNIKTGEMFLTPDCEANIPKDEIKAQILNGANILDYVHNLIKKEGMPFLAGVDKEHTDFTHVDIPALISRMREFAQKFSQ